VGIERSAFDRFDKEICKKGEITVVGLVKKEIQTPSARCGRDGKRKEKDNSSYQSEVQIHVWGGNLRVPYICFSPWKGLGFL
jgi:hypothetical protein